MSTVISPINRCPLYLQNVGIGDDGLLLQIPDEPVTKLWAYEVSRRKSRREYVLTDDDRGPENRARVLQLQKGHQMHPLVLGLLQQGVNPSVIPLHPPQGVQVPEFPKNFKIIQIKIIKNPFYIFN